MGIASSTSAAHNNPIPNSITKRNNRDSDDQYGTSMRRDINSSMNRATKKVIRTKKNLVMVCLYQRDCHFLAKIPKLILYISQITLLQLYNMGLYLN